jgi:hypothetical protein
MGYGCAAGTHGVRFEPLRNPLVSQRAIAHESHVLVLDPVLQGKERVKKESVSGFIWMVRKRERVKKGIMERVQ